MKLINKLKTKIEKGEWVFRLPSGKVLTPDESKFSSLREYVSEIGVKQDIVEMVTSGGVRMCGIGCGCKVRQSNVFSIGIPAVRLFVLFDRVCVAPHVVCGVSCIKLPCNPCA